MIYWDLWLLLVRQKCILIYNSSLCNLNQELWPMWRGTSATSSKDLLIIPTERLAKGNEEPQPKIWTPLSTPVSSWNPLNRFLFAKLTEKVKRFCSRLRNRACRSCPRENWVLYLMKMPLQWRNRLSPQWQPEDCSQNSISAPTHSLFTDQKGDATLLMDDIGHPGEAVQYSTRKPRDSKYRTYRLWGTVPIWIAAQSCFWLMLKTHKVTDFQQK